MKLFRNAARLSRAACAVAALALSGCVYYPDNGYYARGDYYAPAPVVVEPAPVVVGGWWGWGGGWHDHDRD